MKIKITLLVILLTNLYSFGQKIDLGFNLEKGKTYSHYSISDMSTEQKIQGQNVDMTIKVEGGMNYKVVGISKEEYDLEINFTSMVMEFNIAGRSININSQNTEEGNERSILMGKMLSKMTESSFNATIKKTGEVSSIMGVDSMMIEAVEDILKEYISDEEQFRQAKEQLLVQFQKSFGKDVLKGQIEQVTYIFPEKKVKIGSQWKNTILVTGQANGEIANTFELLDYDKSTATIQVTSIMKSDPSKDFQYTDGMLIKQDVEGKYISKIIIDRKTGWIIESDMTTEMTGNSYVKQSISSGEVMTIPIIMKGSTVTTGARK